MFKKLGIAPRWIIFLIDLACVLLSILIAYVIRLNFNLVRLVDIVDLYLSFGIVAGVNIVLLLLFKNYKGVVRYTTLEDAKRVLLLNLSASILFLIINYNLPRSPHILLFPLSVIAIYFLCTNFSLIAYRIVIKTIYENMFSLRKKTLKAVIYNANYEGMLAKRMFTNNERSIIKIVSFLDDNPRLIGKKIENVPVYSVTRQNLQKLKKEGTELLIIAEPFINKEKLIFLVDTCLELDIKIQQVPPSEKWTNNELDDTQLKNINIEQLLDREVISLRNESVIREIKGKKILVTGAAGSIGSELVRQLIKYNPAVVIMCDVAETPLHELMLTFNESAPIKSFIGDIKDRVRMEQIFEIYEPDIVYHAAAYKHVPLMEEHPSAAIVNNVMGTKILAELSVAYGVEKFVMVSTDKAVNPTNVMGASKRIAEIYTQSYHKHLSLARQNNGPGIIPQTRFITTRFGNVLGSNGSVIPRFQKQLEEGGPITVTHPEITRYFMTIPEACQLVLEAGAMGKGGEIFVFDMGLPVKIVDLAYKMIRLSGKVPDVDIKIVYSGLRPGEKLYEELLNNSENTLPTYHEKILIARVREYDFVWVQTEIAELLRLAQNHIVLDTVIKMKEIVPEYVSNNSTYSKLDK
ncbi:polysaccharide biosynthesis protein [Taibaiella sp. KBW10]|uniref:polysaccharide biosynthesis protein n=1 Tax=Taibaiella sp. KBW10 TaxID=2153357 RepID=UPI000F5A4267|nr:nucleoside-diphosphate sugar epimerase/dehydratase [Taibaiella sp. KBW10]RQO30438.1 polysaccharide biosynthesis protein [Taibaiella sp. KBW10]